MVALQPPLTPMPSCKGVSDEKVEGESIKGIWNSASAALLLAGWKMMIFYPFEGWHHEDGVEPEIEFG